MTEKSQKGDERGTKSKRRKRTKTSKKQQRHNVDTQQETSWCPLHRVCVCVNLLACSVSLRDRQETRRGEERKKEEEGGEDETKKER